MLALLSPSQLATVCHLCGDSGEHNIPNLCNECLKDIPFEDIGSSGCNACGSLSETETAAGYRPLYDSSLSVVRYERPVDILFNRLKHHRDITVAATFANLLAKKIVASKAELPDVIVPIPLNWKRQLMRGFNQSQCIAVILASKLGVKIDTTALTRVTSNVPQQGLSRKERLKNLDRCFEADKSVRNKKVALLDDVITTGATMQAAATALYIRGTSKIFAWSVARTP